MTDGFENRVKKIMAMRSLTEDEIINCCWGLSEGINNQGFIAFEMYGAIQWQPEGARISKDEVELETGYYDINGRNINYNQPKMHSQWNLNTFTINGKLKRKISDDPSEAKRDLEIAIEDIYLLTDLFGFFHQGNIDWRPACQILVDDNSSQMDKNHPTWTDDMPKQFFMFKGLNKYQTEQTSLVLDNVSVDRILDGYSAIKAGKLGQIEGPVRESLTWLRSGLNQTWILNQYLNIFQALESIVNELYNRLPSGEKKKLKKNEKKDKIIERIGKNHPG